MVPHGNESLAAQYRQDGYAVIFGFFDASLLGQYKSFVQHALTNDVEPVFNKYGLSVFSKTPHAQVRFLIENTSSMSAIEQQILLGQFPRHIRLSEEIMPVAECLGKSLLIQALLESENLYMHMPPMVRFVPAHYGAAGVPPHQDVSYNRHLSRFLTIWAPMVPITDTCGGLIMYQGSQHLPEILSEEKRPDDWLPPVDTSRFARKKIVGVGLGDAVVLSSHIVHESAANTSDTIRLSIDLRVFGEQDKSTKHSLDLRSMTTCVAKHAPLQRIA
jgi:ectoine hydroxylase-related dioxygenase (phytanoyl-CoA dioxygenase family)